MTSMGLPIASQGTPPTGGTSNFGQPGGVVLGAPAGQFGGVQGTTPAQGYQNRVSPRSNVRFDIQPQVTIAVKPIVPLPEGTKRKDYLLTVRVPDTANNRPLVNLKKTGHKGTIVCGIQQANAALFSLEGADYAANSVLERIIMSGLDSEDIDGKLTLVPGSFKGAADFDKLARIHRTLVPFGVYNNRGTFDGQEAFQQIDNSNVGNIIGVNISNYCFMRDIFGTRLKQGDALELWYLHHQARNLGPNTPKFEIFPVSGCILNNDRTIDLGDLMKTYGSTGTLVRAAEASLLAAAYNPIYRYRLGRVWAKPIHSGFQRTEAVNIVAHDAEENAETMFGSISNPQGVFKNIEVELTPNVMT